MGGVSQPTPVAPLAPVQVTETLNVPDNSYMMNMSMYQNDGMMELAAQQSQQNYLMMQSASEAQASNIRAEQARMEQEDMINADMASEQAETDERNYRKAKGKRDLLFATATGVNDDDENSMLLLGE